MAVAVIRDFVAARDYGARERPMALHALADTEEGGAGPVLIEHIEHTSGDFRIRPVVDGDSNRGGRGTVIAYGARHRREMGPVRAQQVTARPQSTARQQKVIGEQRRKGPGPPVRSQECDASGT